MNQILFLAFIFISSAAWTQMPDSKWLGDWKGELEIASIGRTERMTVQMGLSIHEIDDSTWQWKLSYTRDTINDARDYKLRSTDREGVYVIDEGNSIELYLSSVADGLYSSFDVSGSDLMIYYEMPGDKGDRIIFRTLASGRPQATGAGDEETPEVVTRIVGSVQHCVLTKKLDVK